MTGAARIRRFAKLLIACSLVALPAPASSRAAGSHSAANDLEQYLAERRAAAMSESAEGDIRSVADILAGGTTFLIEKGDDGSYGRSYSTSYCVRPGESAEQKRLRTEAKLRAATELQRLKAAADFDHSGFVSSSEGHRLRELVELGLVVEQLPPDEAATVGSVARAVGRPETWVAASVAAYEQLRLSLDGTQGVKLPAVPRELLSASAAAASPQRP